MTRKAAVIGSPIGHSLSPVIFNFLIEKLGISDFSYDAIGVLTENLPLFIKRLRDEKEWVGVNVTIPHKEEILNYLDDVSPAVKAIGAANVLHVKDGKLTGHNTDVVGIKESFRWGRVHLKGRRVVILGAGGAARAAAFACAEEGAEQICIYNRSLHRVSKLVTDLKKTFPYPQWMDVSSLKEIPFGDGDLLIQSTPVGMAGHGNVEEAESFYNEVFRHTAPGGFALDLIYRPEETPFTRAATRHGFQTMSGLNMLIGQALATWQLWIGPLNDKESLAEQLATKLRLELGNRP